MMGTQLADLSIKLGSIPLAVVDDPQFAHGMAITQYSDCVSFELLLVVARPPILRNSHLATQDEVDVV